MKQVQNTLMALILICGTFSSIKALADTSSSNSRPSMGPPPSRGSSSSGDNSEMGAPPDGGAPSDMPNDDSSGGEDDKGQTRRQSTITSDNPQKDLALKKLDLAKAKNELKSANDFLAKYFTDDVYDFIVQVHFEKNNSCDNYKSSQVSCDKLPENQRSHCESQDDIPDVLKNKWLSSDNSSGYCKNGSRQNRAQVKSSICRDHSLVNSNYRGSDSLSKCSEKLNSYATQKREVEKLQTEVEQLTQLAQRQNQKNKMGNQNQNNSGDPNMALDSDQQDININQAGSQNQNSQNQQAMQMQLAMLQAQAMQQNQYGYSGNQNMQAQCVTCMLQSNGYSFNSQSPQLGMQLGQISSGLGYYTNANMNSLSNTQYSNLNQLQMRMMLQSSQYPYASSYFGNNNSYLSNYSGLSNLPNWQIQQSGLNVYNNVGLQLGSNISYTNSVGMPTFIPSSSVTVGY